MHAVILHEKDNNCKNYTKAYSKLVSVLLKLKCTYENLEITKRSFKHCTGCLDCWIKTPGECRFNDFGRRFAEKVIKSDLFIILTPITFGNYSNTIKKALERLLPNIHPYFESLHGKIHHKKRYSAYPAVIPIGILKDNSLKEEEVFRMLTKRNLITFYSEQSREIIINNKEQISIMENEIADAIFKINKLGGVQV
jgi:multimeric flavodoxin WrbA